ncbi:ATP-binding protein [Sphaerisporangium dianthi]|uniref:ATP-binding protein n=1 Tax=Sphaerisporangium dianthi TaxID=1436120 RepID=A0ABV9CNC9_9ACTN
MPETSQGLRTACWEIAGDASIVGGVRALVRETLGGWGLSLLADDVVLVVGELLANALSHGEPPIRVSMWAGDGDLFVWVTDHGAGLPYRPVLGLDSTHGRGLAIVAALAHGHGVTPLTGATGKTVWARWGHSGHDDTTIAPGREEGNFPRDAVV